MQNTYIRNEKDNITRAPINIKRWTRDCCEHFSTNISDSDNKIYWKTQVKTGDLNNSISFKEIEFFIWNFSTKKTPAWMTLLVNSIKHKNGILDLLRRNNKLKQTLSKNEGKWNISLLALWYQPDKDTSRNDKYRVASSLSRDNSL